MAVFKQVANSGWSSSSARASQSMRGDSASATSNNTKENEEFVRQYVMAIASAESGFEQLRNEVSKQIKDLNEIVSRPPKTVPYRQLNPNIISQNRGIYNILKKARTRYSETRMQNMLNRVIIPLSQLINYGSKLAGVQHSDDMLLEEDPYDSVDLGEAYSDALMHTSMSELRISDIRGD